MPLTPSSRVVLVPDARAVPTGPHAAKIRRYRLARMRLIERRDAESLRHPHLSRTYD